MRKGLQRAVTMAICLVAVLLTAAMPAKAEETASFDFGSTYLTIGAGETKELSVFCTNRYSVFVTGNTSKDTKIGYTGLAGNQTVTLYVGSDEESATVYFWFYPRDNNYDFLDDSYKRCVTVRVNPTGKKEEKPAVQDSSISVTLADGTNGTAKTLDDATVGLLSDAEGTPLAAFALTADNAHQAFTLESASKGFLYVTVDTKAAVTLEISDADKAAAAQVGIYGLVINGTPYFF
ncbi:MAG: hypothetical protein ACI4OJ_03230 [Lachnospiraceae bacterium]